MNIVEASIKPFNKFKVSDKIIALFLLSLTFFHQSIVLLIPRYFSRLISKTYFLNVAEYNYDFIFPTKMALENPMLASSGYWADSRGLGLLLSALSPVFDYGYSTLAFTLAVLYSLLPPISYLFFAKFVSRPAALVISLLISCFSYSTIGYAGADHFHSFFIVLNAVLLGLFYLSSKSIYIVSSAICCFAAFLFKWPSGLTFSFLTLLILILIASSLSLSQDKPTLSRGINHAFMILRFLVVAYLALFSLAVMKGGGILQLVLFVLPTWVISLSFLYYSFKIVHIDDLYMKRIYLWLVVFGLLIVSWLLVNLYFFGGYDFIKSRYLLPFEFNNIQYDKSPHSFRFGWWLLFPISYFVTIMFLVRIKNLKHFTTIFIMIHIGTYLAIKHLLNGGDLPLYSYFLLAIRPVWEWDSVVFVYLLAIAAIALFLLSVFEYNYNKSSLSRSHYSLICALSSVFIVNSLFPSLDETHVKMRMVIIMFNCGLLIALLLDRVTHYHQRMILLLVILIPLLVGVPRTFKESFNLLSMKRSGAVKKGTNKIDVYIDKSAVEYLEDINLKLNEFVGKTAFIVDMHSDLSYV